MSVSVEDRSAIHDLLASYAWLQNEGDGEAWADLWTDDAELDVQSGGLGPQIDISTREARLKIPAFSVQIFGGKQRHHIHNILVEPGPDKDTVKVKAYVLVHNWLKDGHPMAFGKEYFTMVRRGGKWKIKTFRAEFLYIDPALIPPA